MVWSVLLIWIFHDPFLAFGEVGKGIGGMWTQLFGNHHQHEWPSPTASCEAWRRATMEGLLQVYGGPKEPTSDDATSGPTEAYTTLTGVLKLHLEQVGPGSDLSQISRITDKALRLAIQMSC
jgi:hypothetical protein